MLKKIEENWKFIAIFCFSLIFRLLLLTSAHHGDLNNNISWGEIAYENGFNGFFEAYRGTDRYIENWPYSAPNQPPLTIYLFTLCKFLFDQIKSLIWYMNWELLIFPSTLVWFWDEKGMDILVKIPSVIADFGIAYLIYKYFKERRKENKGIILAIVWLFNPLVWYNSSVWGQTDSIVNFLGFAGVLYLIKKNLEKFAIFFTLSLLFKPSLSVFLPVLIAVAILQKYYLKKYLLSAFYVLLTTLIVSFIFHPKPNIFLWLFSLYTERFIPGEIGFLTANSFNFWWLVDPGKVMDDTLFFGLSARIWGFLFTICGFLAVVIYLRKNLSDKNIFLSLSMSALISFLFMTRIHERYLYPFFPVSTVLLGFLPLFWLPYVIISLIHLMNLYNNFWVPDVLAFKRILMTPAVPKILSLVSIVILPVSVLVNSLHKTKKI